MFSVRVESKTPNTKPTIQILITKCLILNLSFYYYFYSSPNLFSGTSQLDLTNTSKHRLPAAVTRQNRSAHDARMGPACYLAFLKSSIIGGPRANDEVGLAARERPQMKSVNDVCIITSSTNH